MSPIRHAWRIDDREYLRHEHRRGRRFAYDEVNATRTAQVVIDMVPFFVEQSPYALGIVPNINRLGEALRGRHGTVAWIVPNGAPARPDFYGPPCARIYGHSVEGAPPAQCRGCNDASNPAATAFWGRAIDRFTGGDYVETLFDDARWRGPVQRFDSRVAVNSAAAGSRRRLPSRQPGRSRHVPRTKA
jgi:hypothetical protein